MRFLRANTRDLNGWRLMQNAANVNNDDAYKAVNVLRYRAEVEFWSGYEENAIKSLIHAHRLARENKSLAATVKVRLNEMQKARMLKI